MSEELANVKRSSRDPEQLRGSLEAWLATRLPPGAQPRIPAVSSPMAKFYRAVEKHQDDAPEPGLSQAYFALGFGHYNAGQVASAIAALHRSVELESNPDAWAQLALIATKTSDERKAGVYIKKARQTLKPGDPKTLYWQARLAGLQAFRIAGQVASNQTQRKAHLAAIKKWNAWLGVGSPPRR